MGENALYRKWITERCNQSAEWRKKVLDRCRDGADGLVYWVDTFVRTKHPKGKDAVIRGFDIPMVSPPHQERFLRWLHAKIMAQEGGGVIEKTREQQATWSVVAVFDWFWLFRQASFLIMSRKEDCVDGKDADQAIMPRFDYIHKRLPAWQMPEAYLLASKKGRNPNRTFLTMTNPDTDCTIKGESTNVRAGASGRALAALVDEASAIDFLEEVLGAIGQVTDCPLFLSTHEGVGTCFNQLCIGGNYEKYRMHWTENEMWTKGLYTCEVNCPAHPLGGQPHSERYDEECKKLNWNEQLIAAQLDINPLKSGNSIFDMDMVSRAMGWIAESPAPVEYIVLGFEDQPALIHPGGRHDFYRVAKNWKTKVDDFSRQAISPFMVWKRPLSCRDKECLCKGTGHHVYVAGGDVAQNSRGRLRDKTVLVILDCTIGEIVACWSGYIDPDEAGFEWSKICKWYGKDSGLKRHCLAGIERNGAAATIGVMDKMNVPLLPNQPTEAYKTNGTHSRDLGINLTRWNRKGLIDDHLAPAIRTPDETGMPILYVPLHDFWDECTTFIAVDSGTDGDIKPDRVRIGAPKTEHDDHIWATTHALFTANTAYGGWRGIVRLPDEEPKAVRLTA